MANKKKIETFEEELRQYYWGPSPRKEFFEKLEQEIQARSSKTDRLPSRRIQPLSPAYLWVVIAFALLIILFVIGPGNVFAEISQWAKYVRGFGLVNRDTAIRVLAKPVLQTRDGVMIDVKQAILTEDKTSIVFSQKGLSPSAIIEYDGQNSDKICSPSVELILPDGTRLSSEEGESLGYDENQASQYVYYFQPLPLGQHRAMFHLSCILGAGKGLAPENWKIPLVFVDAPTNYTQMPVIDITPSPATTTIQPSPIAPLLLERVIVTDDGYIFMGQFRALRAESTLMKSVEQLPYITDRTGSHLTYTIPGDLPQGSNGNGGFWWAYEIKNKEIAWPITIHFDSVSATCEKTAFQIKIETRLGAEEGQIWKVNKDFDDNLCGFRLVSLMRTSSGYLFDIESNKNQVRQVFPVIAGATPISDDVRVYKDYIVESIKYARKEEVPTGRLNISFPMVVVEVPGPWSVQWQP